jgi:hypothetical protein
VQKAKWTMILASLKTTISTISDLTFWLSKWNFGAGMEPSIFPLGGVPESVATPYVTLEILSGDKAQSTRGSVIEDVQARINVYDDNQRSDFSCRTWVTLIQRFLHHKQIAITGYGVCNVQTTPIERAPERDGIGGYSTRVTLTLKES